MNKKPSKKDIIKQYLLDGNKVSPLEAFRLCGSMRLSAIIFDLKDEGMNIKSEMVYEPSGVRYARYYLG